VHQNSKTPKVAHKTVLILYKREHIILYDLLGPPTTRSGGTSDLHLREKKRFTLPAGRFIPPEKGLVRAKPVQDKPYSALRIHCPSHGYKTISISPICSPRSECDTVSSCAARTSGCVEAAVLNRMMEDSALLGGLRWFVLG
jgi:hypothetical protein